MEPIDEKVLREWVDLDLEGELEVERKKRLELELEKRPALVAERRELAAMQTLFAESRIAVDESFGPRVMAALPRAAWEPRAASRRAWALPLALAAVFAFAGVVALGGAESHVLGIGLTVVHFFQATVVAGAGLALATWRGLGYGLEELVGGSSLSLVALLVLVLFVDLLFLVLLRRRPVAEKSSGEADDR